MRMVEEVAVVELVSLLVYDSHSILVLRIQEEHEVIGREDDEKG